MPGLTFTPLELPGLLLISGRVFADDRGFFLEGYRESEMLEAGLPRFGLDNSSRASRDTIRGLHYQMRAAAQGKLMRCLRGKGLNRHRQRRGHGLPSRKVGALLDSMRGPKDKLRNHQPANETQNQVGLPGAGQSQKRSSPRRPSIRYT